MHWKLQIIKPGVRPGYYVRWSSYKGLQDNGFNQLVVDILAIIVTNYNEVVSFALKCST